MFGWIADELNPKDLNSDGLNTDELSSYGLNSHGLNSDGLSSDAFNSDGYKIQTSLLATMPSSDERNGCIGRSTSRCVDHCSVAQARCPLTAAAQLLQSQ